MAQDLFGGLKTLFSPVLFSSILLFFLLPVCMEAQSTGFSGIKDEAGFKKKLEEKAATTKTIQSVFSQEKGLSFLEETIHSEGQFFFREDNKVRWEYLKPFTYIIIIDDQKLFIKDEGNLSKIDMGNNAMFNEINNLVTGSIRGQIVDNKQFTSAYFEGSTEYEVRLKPKNPKMAEYIKEIIIHFGKSDMGIRSVQIVELSDDYTKITFGATKYNVTIPDSRFNP